MAIKNKEEVLKQNTIAVQNMTNRLKTAKELTDVAMLSLGKAVDLNIKDLAPFKNHTYEIKEDKVAEYAESIKDYGLFTPIIVWDKNESLTGKYEILAGHHRVEACKRIGRDTIPAIIKTNLNEEKALAIVHQTNMMQRSFEMLSIYEKASSIAQMKEAREKMEEKNPEMRKHNDPQISGTKAIGREFGITYQMVSIYLTLYKNLNKKQFEYMEDTQDKKKLFDLNTGVILCKLPKNVLKDLFKFIEDSKVVKKINKKQAQELVEIYNKNEELTEKDFNNILVYTQINNKNSKPLSLTRDMLKDYFDESDTDEEIIQEIIYMLKERKRA